MGRTEDLMNGDFDFDGEAKDFRKTIGGAAIVLGILFLIFNSYFFVKSMKVVIGGESFVADVVRGPGGNTAEYKDGDQKYTYDISNIIISDSKEKITLYYKGDIHDAIAVNWKMFIYSYIGYTAILVLGILGANNIGLKDIIKKISSKKK